MKGKRLEILVLVVAFALLLTAGFFMYFYNGAGESAAKKIVLVNRIFSMGFIVYIIYSYLLSTNLNTEIANLNKNIGNLKEEVARKKVKIEKGLATIKTQEQDIDSLNGQVSKLTSSAESLESQLSKANSEISKLKTEVEDKA